MKLYYFETGFGGIDYYVMADTEEEARGAVDKYIKDKWGHDDDWPKRYDVHIHEPLEVLAVFNS